MDKQDYESASSSTTKDRFSKHIMSGHPRKPIDIYSRISNRTSNNTGPLVVELVDDSDDSDEAPGVCSVPPKRNITPPWRKTSSVQAGGKKPIRLSRSAYSLGGKENIAPPVNLSLVMEQENIAPPVNLSLVMEQENIAPPVNLSLVMEQESVLLAESTGSFKNVTGASGKLPTHRSNTEILSSRISAKHIPEKGGNAEGLASSTQPLLPRNTPRMAPNSHSSRSSLSTTTLTSSTCISTTRSTPPISTTTSTPPISTTASSPPISTTRSTPSISTTTSTPPISTTTSASPLYCTNCKESKLRTSLSPSDSGFLDRLDNRAAKTLCKNMAVQTPSEWMQTEGKKSRAPPPLSRTDTDASAPVVSVNSRSYTVLGVIGKGGSSKVEKVIDFEGSRCLALKSVTLADQPPQAIQAFLKEVEMLRKLQFSDKVIQLIDFEHRLSESKLLLLLECGDTDLSVYLKKLLASQSLHRMQRCVFWLGMLEAVKVLHDQGIVHSDIKPENFMLVAGQIKLIDFGIAKQLDAEATSMILENCIGTLNYMSPEVLQGATVRDVDSKYLVCVTVLRLSMWPHSRCAVIVDLNKETGVKLALFQECVGRRSIVPLFTIVCEESKAGRKADVWSLGCILYYMAYGHTPFQSLRMVEKVAAIVNPQHVIQMPEMGEPHLTQTLKMCLVRDYKKRAGIGDLLSHEYIR